MRGAQAAAAPTESSQVPLDVAMTRLSVPDRIWCREVSLAGRALLSEPQSGLNPPPSFLWRVWNAEPRGKGSC